MTNELGAVRAALLAGFGILTGLCLSVAGAADEKKGPNVSATPDGKVSKAGEALEQLALASSLIEYGRREKSPEALLAAAQILARTPLPVKKDEKPEETPAEGKAAPKGTKSKNPLAYDAKTLLAEAKKLRPDDKHLAALADDIASEKTRGTLQGGTLWEGSIDGGVTHKTTRRFIGGEKAYVNARGDGDTQLRLTVTDEDGNFINGFTGNSPWIRWTPNRSGIYIIRVRNMGDMSNNYSLVTN